MQNHHETKDLDFAWDFRSFSRRDTQSWTDGSPLPAPYPVGKDGFVFTLANGTVTAESIQHGTNSRAITLSSNDSFTVGTDIITETVKGSASTETITFAADSSGGSIYHISAEQVTFADPAHNGRDGNGESFTFALSNGAVSGISETVTKGDLSWTSPSQMPKAASFALGKGTVTEARISGDIIYGTVYSAESSGGGYQISGQSETLIAQGSATTRLDVRPDHQASFTLASDGSIAKAALTGPGGWTLTITPDSTFAFKALGTGYVEETVTRPNGDSHFVLYYDGAGKGAYTEIATGHGTSVDLTGIAAQIAQLPSGLAQLI